MYLENKNKAQFETSIIGVNKRRNVRSVVSMLRYLPPDECTLHQIMALNTYASSTIDEQNVIEK